MQVDPYAESFYPLSPYNSMGNNPIRYNDPNGDFIPQLAIGLKIGSLAIQVLNGGSNTLTNVMDITSSVLSLASGNLSGIAKLGFNGIRPDISVGSNGFHLGVTVGIGLNTQWFNAGINASIGYTHMNLGPNSVSGFTSSFGGGATLGNRNLGLGLYSNQTFGAGIGQQVAGFRVNVAGAHISYENDNAPFDKLGAIGNALKDEGDRWRTNAVSIGYGGVDLRLNMFTGEPTGDPSKPSDEYPQGYYTGNADRYRLGALSVGYNGYRVGWNSEGIRHLFQNKFAHQIMRPQAYFKKLASGYPGSFYSEISTFSNPYSLWSF